VALIFDGEDVLPSSTAVVRQDRKNMGEQFHVRLHWAAAAPRVFYKGIKIR